MPQISTAIGSIYTYEKLVGITPTDWSQRYTIVVSETTWTAVGSGLAYINKVPSHTEWFREPKSPTDWSEWHWASRTIFDWNQWVLKGGILERVPTIAINSGGEQYTATDGITWAADCFVDGGYYWSANASFDKTSDDFLYQSERFGNFAYTIPLKRPDYYVVQFKFSENWWDAAGQRVFNVAVEGQNHISGLDVYKSAGGKYTALDLFRGVDVTDGFCNIDFVDDAQPDFPKIGALAIYRVKR
jgi:hypothetical protein